MLNLKLISHPLNWFTLFCWLAFISFAMIVTHRVPLTFDDGKNTSPASGITGAQPNGNI